MDSVEIKFHIIPSLKMRARFLMELMSSMERNVLLMGPRGGGKTCLIDNFYNSRGKFQTFDIYLHNVALLWKDGSYLQALHWRVWTYWYELIVGWSSYPAENFLEYLRVNRRETIGKFTAGSVNLMYAMKIYKNAKEETRSTACERNKHAI